MTENPMQRNTNFNKKKPLIETSNKMLTIMELSDKYFKATGMKTYFKEQ